MKRISFLLSLLFAFFAVEPSRLFAAEPYGIHVLLSLTGSGSFLGQAEQKSIERVGAIFNQNGGINGRPVQFIFHDDQTNPQTAVQLLNEILPTKPAVVLGSAIAAVCNAIAPLMRSGPVNYCLSPAIYPSPGSYVFTSNVSSEDTFRTVLRYYGLKGWNRVALLNSTDATGQDSERWIPELLKLPENKGIELVAHERFNITDISVAAQMEKIKAANPQAMMSIVTGTALATVSRSMMQAGLDIPFATTYGNMTHAQMSQYAEFLPRQLYFPSAEWPPHPSSIVLDPAVEAAQKAYFAAFAGEKLDVGPTMAWDPAMIVVSALRQIGDQATADQIRDYISKLKGYAGVNGLYDFVDKPQRGLGPADVVISKWDAAAKTWNIVSKPRGEPIN